MTALLFSITLLLLFALAGRGFLALFPRVSGPVGEWLLAPCVGLSIAILAISLPNYWGLPVGLYASPVFVGMVALVAGNFRRLPRRCEWKFVGIVGLILLFFFGYNAWPMLVRGFNWIAYANGDASHFCSIAARLIEQAFFHVPSLKDHMGYDTLAAANNFHHTFGSDRFGTEEVLAWAAKISGRPPVEIYMPLNFASAASVVTSLGALVYSGECRFRGAALTAMLLLSAAPLGAVSVYHQLLPQTNGLVLSLGFLALIIGAPSKMFSRRGLSRCLVITLVASAFCITYPELAPFSIFAFLLYLVARAILGNTPVPLIRQTVVSTFGMAILLNSTLLLMLIFMWFTRLPSASGQANSNVFLWFLTPGASPSIFGILPYPYFRESSNHPWAVVVSVLPLLGLILSWVVALKKNHIIGWLFFVYISGFLLLVFNNNGFGAFKSALYMTPALSGVFAMGVFSLRRRRLRVFALAAIVGMGLYTQHYYSNRSLGRSYGGLQDTRGASTYGISSLGLDPETRIFIDVPQHVFYQHLSTETRHHYTYYGNAASFGARPRFRSPGEDLPSGEIKWDFHLPVGENDTVRRKGLELVWPPEFEKAEGIAKKAHETCNSVYSFHNSLFALSRNPDINHFQDFLYIGMPSRGLPFNHLSGNEFQQKKFWSVSPISELRNHLVFLNSSRGYMPVYGFRYDASIYPAEGDLYRPSKPFFRVGDFLLFQVINPEPTFRFRVSLTRTIVPKGHKSLEGIMVIHGQESVLMDMRGSGAASMISPPISAARVGGIDVIAVEFKCPEWSFSNGVSLSLEEKMGATGSDTAFQIGYLRDMSLVSEAQLDANACSLPTSLTAFPGDLFQNDWLEFSGISEDGWLGDRCFLSLGASAPGDQVELEIHVPNVGKKEASLTATINGEKVPEVSVEPGGDRVVRLPIAKPDSKTRIELECSPTVEAEEPDGRNLTFRLKSVKIRNGEDTAGGSGEDQK